MAPLGVQLDAGVLEIDQVQLSRAVAQHVLVLNVIVVQPRVGAEALHQSAHVGRVLSSMIG